jgi:hypothetical protein
VGSTGWVRECRSRADLSSAAIVRGFVGARDTDDAHRLGQLAVAVQVIERGNEFARRQVATGAEDDHATGFDLAMARVEPAGQKFVQEIWLIHQLGGCRMPG